ncbi:MAG: hypothetical protein ACRERZ_05940, partial [Gammaproteobacteria bacterium]
PGLSQKNTFANGEHSLPRRRPLPVQTALNIGAWAMDCFQRTCANLRLATKTAVSPKTFQHAPGDSSGEAGGATAAHGTAPMKMCPNGMHLPMIA